MVAENFVPKLYCRSKDVCIGIEKLRIGGAISSIASQKPLQCNVMYIVDLYSALREYTSNALDALVLCE